MIKNIFILSFLIVLLSSFVISDKIVTTQVAGNLEIKYPDFETYIVNMPIELNFHVYNSSGSELTSPNAECNIHLYNQEGHILILNLTSEAIGDFNLTLPDNISSTVGEYQYLLYCTNFIEYGLVSDNFEIVRNNIFKSYKGIGLVIVALGLIFFLGFLSFGLANDHLALKVIFFGFSVFGTYILTSVFSTLNPEIRLMNYAKWAGYIFVAYLIIYLIYYFFLKVFVDNFVKKFKRK